MLVKLLNPYPFFFLQPSSQHHQQQHLTQYLLHLGIKMTHLASLIRVQFQSQRNFFYVYAHMVFCSFCYLVTLPKRMRSVNSKTPKHWIMLVNLYEDLGRKEIKAGNTLAEYQLFCRGRPMATGAGILRSADPSHMDSVH